MIRWRVVMALVLGLHSPCFALTLAEQLTAWRAAQGLSQCAAAQRVMVSCSTWRRWERGENTPNAYNQQTLSNLGVFGADGVDVAFVFNENPPPDALESIRVEMPDGTTRTVSP